jgi:hypothetical protein
MGKRSLGRAVDEAKVKGKRDAAKDLSLRTRPAVVGGLLPATQARSAAQNRRNAPGETIAFTFDKIVVE